MLSRAAISATHGHDRRSPLSDCSRGRGGGEEWWGATAQTETESKNNTSETLQGNKERKRAINDEDDGGAGEGVEAGRTLQ